MKTTQNISLSSTPITKKAERIELRSLNEVYPLSRNKSDLPNIPLKPHPINEKKRVSVFCLGEEINLKKLSTFTKTDSLFSKTILYYGECLYSKIKFNHFSTDESLYSDILFMKYGVIITWGLLEKQENILINKISPFITNEYKNKEYENLHYTILNEEIVSYFSNDIFYLNNNDFFTKMIISNSLAQSVKLDYFENSVDLLIDRVKNLPGSLLKGIKSNDVMELLGKLFEVKFDINLTSNILDEPEVLWYYPEYSNLYEAMKHCLEIDSRTGLLNQRCNTMEGLLKLLIERKDKAGSIIGGNGYWKIGLITFFSVFFGGLFSNLIGNFFNKFFRFYLF
ncbi:Sporulation protein RMD1 [Cucumispora dikerogammari]|nr:Sporulation protein RMD1 [Cucumispora dikerogammari]